MCGASAATSSGSIDAPAQGRRADTQPCRRVPLPVDLRTPRHRQPRGDGLRDGSRGDAHRRHPRGRGRRRDRAARAVRAAADGSRDPVDPERFACDIAERVNELVADPSKAQNMGEAGRRRAIEHFAWPAIAAQTLALYEQVTNRAD